MNEEREEDRERVKRIQIKNSQIYIVRKKRRPSF